MRVSGIPYVQGRNSYSDADGTKTGIAIHNTSNTASADNEAAYAQRRTDGVSSHFYADGTKVVQSLDTSARAGHAGSSQGNQNAVAVEIRGVNGWSRQQWLDGVCWDLLGGVLAQVCRAYGIAVRRASVGEMQGHARVRAFYSHDDMRRAWGGTDHTDPGPSFPWDRLFQAVNTALNPVSAPAPTPHVEEDSVFIAKANSGQLYVSDGMYSRPISAGELGDLKTLIGEGLVKVNGDPNNPRTGFYAGAYGVLQAPAPIDPAVLAAALAPLLSSAVSEEELVAALTSEAGQAALVQAANKAEDS